MIISYEIANYKIYEDVYASSVGEGVTSKLYTLRHGAHLCFCCVWPGQDTFFFNNLVEPS